MSTPEPAVRGDDDVADGGIGRLRRAPAAMAPSLGAAWVGRSAAGAVVLVLPTRPSEAEVASGEIGPPRLAEVPAPPAFPHVLPLLATGVDAAGGEWIAVPSVGELLAERLRAGPLLADEALVVGRDLATGLAALHAAGLAHGGLRPASVWLADGSGRASMLPPGVLAPVGVPASGPVPLHVAPEVLAGGSPAAAADAWALGSVLHQCLEGRAPFAREAALGADAVVRRIRTGGPPERTRPLVPRPVCLLIDDLLLAEPADRPTADEVRRELADLVPAAGPTTVRPRSVVPAAELETLPPGGTAPPGALRSAVPADDAVAPGNGPPRDEGPAGAPGATGGSSATVAAAGPNVGSPVSGSPLGSRYVVTSPIGRGAMGEVWRGYRRDDHRPVAVKVLRPELGAQPALVGRFLREREALTRLDHPCLVRVHDLVVEGSTLAIVMDLVDGVDLRHTLDAGPVDPRLARRLLGELSAGVAEVHRQGIVHRDLKPENVLVVAAEPGAPVVRITDFGVAWLDGAETLTAVAELLGTPAYLAPEVVAGAPGGPPVDVYALGVIAYELLTGVRPFRGESAAAVLAAHTDQTPPPLHGVDPELATVVLACLAKDPVARPTADELARRWRPEPGDRAPAPAAPMVDDVDDVDDAVGTRWARHPLAEPVGPATSQSTPRRRRVLAGLMAVGLVAGAAVAVWSARNDDPQLVAGGAGAGSAGSSLPSGGATSGGTRPAAVAVRVEAFDRTATGQLALTVPPLEGVDRDGGSVVVAVADGDRYQPASSLVTDADGDGRIDHVTADVARGSCVLLLVVPVDGRVPTLPDGSPIPTTTNCQEVDR